MYVGREIGAIYATTNAANGFDFVNDMATGDAVINAVANLLVEIGIDPSPISHLYGTPFINPPTVVIQKVANLLPGVTYLLQLIVNTTGGDTLSLYTRIPSEPVY